MTKRNSKIIIANVSREEAEAAFAEYSKADAQIIKINAEMDLAFSKIREKNQDKLAELEKLKEDSFARLNVFAEKNPDLFGKKKSVELAHGTIGFRTGTPKLKLRKGFQWNAVLELLRNNSILKKYVRTSEEVAKDKLLADREDPEVSTRLADVGIMVDQDERFYVEPKKEAEA